MIAELERSIARYKEEYAILISEAQAIKADLASVEAKVIFLLCLKTCSFLTLECFDSLKMFRIDPSFAFHFLIFSFFFIRLPCPYIDHSIG